MAKEKTPQERSVTKSFERVVGSSCVGNLLPFMTTNQRINQARVRKEQKHIKQDHSE